MSAIISLADTAIYTYGRVKTSGKPFTYAIRSDKMFISIKAKSITRVIIMIAYRKAVEIKNAKGYVFGPKRIGIFGESNL